MRVRHHAGLGLHRGPTRPNTPCPIEAGVPPRTHTQQRPAHACIRSPTRAPIPPTPMQNQAPTHLRLRQPGTRVAAHDDGAIAGRRARRPYPASQNRQLRQRQAQRTFQGRQLHAPSREEESIEQSPTLAQLACR